MIRILTLAIAAAALSLASCASMKKKECTSCCEKPAKKECCAKAEAAGKKCEVCAKGKEGHQH